MWKLKNKVINKKEDTTDLKNILNNYNIRNNQNYILWKKIKYDFTVYIVKYNLMNKVKNYWKVSIEKIKINYKNENLKSLKILISFLILWYFLKIFLFLFVFYLGILLYFYFSKNTMSQNKFYLILDRKVIYFKYININNNLEFKTKK